MSSGRFGHGVNRLGGKGARSGKSGVCEAHAVTIQTHPHIQRPIHHPLDFFRDGPIFNLNTCMSLLQFRCGVIRLTHRGLFPCGGFDHEGLDLLIPDGAAIKPPFSVGSNERTDRQRGNNQISIDRWGDHKFAFQSARKRRFNHPFPYRSNATVEEYRIPRSARYSEQMSGSGNFPTADSV